MPTWFRVFSSKNIWSKIFKSKHKYYNKIIFNQSTVDQMKRSEICLTNGSRSVFEAMQWYMCSWTLEQLDTCATRQLCDQTLVSLDTNVTRHFWDWTLVQSDTHVTGILYNQMLAQLDTCATKHFCSWTLVWPDTCVTGHLSTKSSYLKDSKMGWDIFVAWVSIKLYMEMHNLRYFWSVLSSKRKVGHRWWQASAT